MARPKDIFSSHSRSCASPSFSLGQLFIGNALEKKSKNNKKTSGGRSHKHFGRHFEGVTGALAETEIYRRIPAKNTTGNGNLFILRNKMGKKEYTKYLKLIAPSEELAEHETSDLWATDMEVLSRQLESQVFVASGSATMPSRVTHTYGIDTHTHTHWYTYRHTWINTSVSHSSGFSFILLFASRLFSLCLCLCLCVRVSSWKKDDLDVD